jgi:GrpB-like predicted nucleotidyltransferase (UPF0157 family)
MSDSPLDQMSAEEIGQLFPIQLVPYNPRWPEIFLREKERLEAHLPGLLRTEHIGSTAVPGLISKPTIDMILEIDPDQDLSLFLEKLEALGYHCIPRPENPPPHYMAVAGYTSDGFAGQAYHLHLRFPGDWDEYYFRDFLRQHPEVSDAYAELKQKLAQTFRNHREKYTEAKGDFVQGVVELARAQKNE